MQFLTKTARIEDMDQLEIKLTEILDLGVKQLQTKFMPKQKT